MTEIKTNNLEFVKYCLTWKFTDEGTDQSSEFFLPKGEDPHGSVGSILSVVEMSASEYGYEYDLTAECWELDMDYIQGLNGEITTETKIAFLKKCFWLKTCGTCFWGDGDSCTKTQDKVLRKMAIDEGYDLADKAESEASELIDKHERDSAEDSRVPSDSVLLGW